jgi:polysaccharide biosynthesis protein PslH
MDGLQLMRVLLLTHRVPYPPNRGDRIRSIHLLKFLAQRAEVSLACPTEEPVAESTRQVLDRLCSQVAIGPNSWFNRSRRAAWSLARGRSATEGYFWHPQLARTIRAWAGAKKFEAIVCYCSGMFRYTLVPELAGVPVLVDLVDVDSQKWIECARRASVAKQWLYELESSRVWKLESEIAERAATVTLVSEEERELFRRVGCSSSVEVVGNGVDLEYFSRQADSPAVAPHTCCFVGVLNYPPNVDGLKWFVELVWPAVQAEVPNARFLIVGKSPEQQVERLSSVPGVELHANVPDVRPYLAQSAVAVAPMQFARGVQNKVLEAMAMEKAVVATPQSLEGLRAKPGAEVLAASDVDEWRAAIVSLMMGPSRAEQLGRAARSYVESNHRWEDCLGPFAEYLASTADQLSRDVGRPAPRNHRQAKVASYT